ncbi:MAG TPA: hypothetical protein VF624_16825 [Tepidisphaeraceae bacterium]|jgi:hypothetical protein
MTSVRSALLLTLFGLLAATFFWATDPAIGVATRVMDPALNVNDASNQAWPGTVVGLIGSGGVVATGLWLLTRRTA